MIKSFKLFESNSYQKIEFDEFRQLVKDSQDFSRYDVGRLKRYFAQFGSKVSNSKILHWYLVRSGSVEIKEVNYSSSVRGYTFNIFKLSGDQEWFGLYVRKSSLYYKPVSDKWVAKNISNPKYTDEFGQSMIVKANWYYKDIKPGYESQMVLRTEDSVECFKCDQIGGVIDKIDEYLKLRKKKEPEEYFNKVKEKEDLTNTIKMAISILRKMSKSQLEEFIKSNS